MLHFQFSPCRTFKNKKRSDYPFSLFEVHITLGFKSESFLIYFIMTTIKYENNGYVIISEIQSFQANEERKFMFLVVFSFKH